MTGLPAEEARRSDVREGFEVTFSCGHKAAYDKHSQHGIPEIGRFGRCHACDSSPKPNAGVDRTVVALRQCLDRDGHAHPLQGAYGVTVDRSLLARLRAADQAMTAGERPASYPYDLEELMEEALPLLLNLADAVYANHKIFCPDEFCLVCAALAPLLEPRK